MSKFMPRRKKSAQRPSAVMQEQDSHTLPPQGAIRGRADTLTIAKGLNMSTQMAAAGSPIASKSIEDVDVLRREVEALEIKRDYDARAHKQFEALRFDLARKVGSISDLKEIAGTLKHSKREEAKAYLDSLSAPAKVVPSSDLIASSLPSAALVSIAPPITGANKTGQDSNTNAFFKASPNPGPDSGYIHRRYDDQSKTVLAVTR
jgi:hypothetical protein